MDRQKVGQKLRQLRQDRGYDYQYVCNMIGISRSALCMYECGYRMPRDEIKVKFADFYRTSVDSLFFSN